MKAAQILVLAVIMCVMSMTSASTEHASESSLAIQEIKSLESADADLMDNEEDELNALLEVEEDVDLQRRRRWRWRRRWTPPRRVVHRPPPRPVHRPAPRPVVHRPAPRPVVHRPAPRPVVHRPAPRPVVHRPAPRPVVHRPVVHRPPPPPPPPPFPSANFIKEANIKIANAENKYAQDTVRIVDNLRKKLIKRHEQRVEADRKENTIIASIERNDLLAQISEAEKLAAKYKTEITNWKRRLAASSAARKGMKGDDAKVNLERLTSANKIDAAIKEFELEAATVKKEAKALASLHKNIYNGIRTGALAGTGTGLKGPARFQPEANGAPADVRPLELGKVINIEEHGQGLIESEYRSDFASLQNADALDKASQLSHAEVQEAVVAIPKSADYEEATDEKMTKHILTNFIEAEGEAVDADLMDNEEDELNALLEVEEDVDLQRRRRWRRRWSPPRRVARRRAPRRVRRRRVVRRPPPRPVVHRPPPRPVHRPAPRPVVHRPPPRPAPRPVVHRPAPRPVVHRPPPPKPVVHRPAPRPVVHRPPPPPPKPVVPAISEAQARATVAAAYAKHASKMKELKAQRKKTIDLIRSTLEKNYSKVSTLPKDGNLLKPALDALRSKIASHAQVVKAARSEADNVEKQYDVVSEDMDATTTLGDNHKFAIQQEVNDLENRIARTTRLSKHTTKLIDRIAPLSYKKLK